MKKLLLLIILSLPAFGQGVRYDGVVLLDTGRPASGATVRVCQAGSSGIPCTPTVANVFSDKALTSALGFSLTTDTHGNYNFYAACNSYDLQFSGSGLTTFTMKDVQIGPCGNFAIRGGMKTVTFSATPVFDASLSSSFRIVLTGNVTSSTLTNAANALPLNIEVCQDATGGRTFVPPANVVGWVAISGTANACTMEEFVYDGTNAVNPIAAPPTVTVVNGVSFPASPALHSSPVTTATNTESYKVIPDCTDTTGNHLNYTQSTDAWSCGTTLTTQVVTLTGSQTLTNKTFTSAIANGTLNGSAIHAQHIGSLSISAGGAAQGQQFSTTQTISQSMGDANFRCVASLAGVSAGSPFVMSCIPATATSVTVTMANGSAVLSTVTAIDIIAVHD